MEVKMINWIEYTSDNAEKYKLFESSERDKYVYFNMRGQIVFSRDILVTHFALKSEYLAILPKDRK
jgi:hypothetical protein